MTFVFFLGNRKAEAISLCVNFLLCKEKNIVFLTELASILSLELISLKLPFWENFRKCMFNRCAVIGSLLNGLKMAWHFFLTRLMAFKIWRQEALTAGHVLFLNPKLAWYFLHFYKIFFFFFIFTVFISSTRMENGKCWKHIYEMNE